MLESSEDLTIPVFGVSAGKIQSQGLLIKALTVASPWFLGFLTAWRQTSNLVAQGLSINVSANKVEAPWLLVT